MMQRYRTPILLCFCAVLCHAQTTKPDLNELRAKYDAPFTRNLQSFDCAIDFSWKDHFKETFRVGDEGSDAELENIFQPIKNRVTVMKDKVSVSAEGLTEADISKMPHGGMAEGLLEHAVEKSLNTWLESANNGILPADGSPVTFGQLPLGYKLNMKMQTAEIEMGFGQDGRLQNATVKEGNQSERIDLVFVPGQQGFLLSSFTIPEDGITAPGHRLIFSYTYQTVNGVAIPEHVIVNRESHREMWHYTLSGCRVKTS